MRVAVFSDVQANLAAMEAAVEDILDWRPDLVVLAGDLVNRGPRNRECVDLFERLRRERGWLPVRGNHEDYVLECGRNPPQDPLHAAIRQFAERAYHELGDATAAMLGDWPDHLCFSDESCRSWVHVTHGTLAGNRDGVTASVSDEQLAGRIPPDLDLFVCAHTHRPLQRRLGSTDILNVGSVGSPFDGDPRASYGRLEHREGRWHTEIRRLPYDRARAERDFVESGFVEEGGPVARLIFEEWRRAELLIPRWRRDYQPAVREGRLGLDESIHCLLGDI